MIKLKHGYGQVQRSLEVVQIHQLFLKGNALDKGGPSLWESSFPFISDLKIETTQKFDGVSSKLPESMTLPCLGCLPLHLHPLLPHPPTLMTPGAGATATASVGSIAACRCPAPGVHRRAPGALGHGRDQCVATWLRCHLHRRVLLNILVKLASCEWFRRDS